MTQDKPAAVGFNFDTHKAEAGEKFGIVINGKHIEIPPAGQLRGIEFFENSLKGDGAATIAMLEEVIPEDDYKALREKTPTLDTINAFVRAYFEHSGMTQGN